MLSLFLNTKNCLPHGPATDENAEVRTGHDSAQVQAETAPDAGNEVPAGDISGLLSVIIANGEFLEVIYGENRYVENILNAAGAAKRHLGDGSEAK